MCQQLSPVLPAIANPGRARGRRRSHLNTSWITAGIGVVIVLVSVALMAVSAPVRSPAPVQPAPASHGHIHLERDAGPMLISGPGAAGSRARPAR
jgi:hypothetical protein